MSEIYWLYWCGNCAGEIRESPPHLLKLESHEFWGNRRLCDCCGERYAIWKKKVNRDDYYNALKTYRNRMERLRGGIRID